MNLAIRWAELGFLVVGAVLVIVGTGILRTQSAHRRRLQEGYPRRPGFFARLRRAIKEARRV